MNIIKEIFHTKQIARDVELIIESQLSELTINKLKDAKDKKAQKKFEQIVIKLKSALKNYVTERQLGIYGSSRVLKTVQNSLLDKGFEIELVRGIVESIMLR